MRPENCSEATIPPKEWSGTKIKALFEKNIFDSFYYARVRFEILEKSSFIFLVKCLTLGLNNMF